jgi:hypothetical protein
MTNLLPSVDDSSFTLGAPTALESYQHRCLMLVDELHKAWAEIRRLKGDTQTLIAMNDALQAQLKGLKACSR